MIGDDEVSAEPTAAGTDVVAVTTGVSVTDSVIVAVGVGVATVVGAVATIPSCRVLVALPWELVTVRLTE